ncbi:4-hydroxy-tetrahydrodipicolinate synthase [Cetobacterium sp. 8H]|uniref:4-hydroxy-tetrahydrodipicolinate synthase n=1 Tax=Cetobacterium sp. 8H TaxID=2759681 RepID=UPI00163C7802|nr:4-hydroxy-tetrahydrodipicolinate synthase [Cetobacterium sp. 8H]MBC2849969.1 4-hydroxy-tetrahydrodipicolinate synthase [Cetobacterium sp. 8H]
MKNIDISGVIVPLLTPMNADETINEKELRNQINHQINFGIHGIFPLGTNGEAYILNFDEKVEVLKIVVDEVNGRVPVYAGTGCVSTKETISLSLKAKEIGVDILSIVTPYFASASQEELYNHFKEVAENVDLPIVLYNIPARSGNSISPSTVEKLSKIQNIVGVKDSSGNFDNMLQYIEKTRSRKDFSVLSGNDSLILWCLLAGGKGGIAGCANVFPRTMSSIYNTFLEGNLEEARRLQDSIRSFRDCFKFGNPNTIVKTAVSLLGFPVGRCRKPFSEVSEEGIEAIKKVLIENKEKGIN